MRILGDINHPKYKITAFVSNGKISIKIEHGLLEQTIKFRDGADIESLENVNAFLDSGLLLAIDQNFNNLQKAKMDALVKMHSGKDKFDVII